MRVGVAGSGRIGEVHVRNLREHRAVRAVMVYDPDRGRAESLAAAHGASAVHSLDALLGEVDALVIASPTPAHAEQLRCALSAGIPVFCEKPVASDLEEIARLTAFADDTGCPVQVGFHYRFDPALRELAERCRRLPGPRHFRVHSTTEFAPSEDYLAGAGGLVADKLIHELDMVRWMSGSEVVRVAALGEGARGDVGSDASIPMTAVLSLQLADGGLASVWGGYRSAAGFDLSVEVETSDVVLVTGNRRPESEKPATVPVSIVTDFRERFVEAYRAELESFISVARGEAESPCTLDEALRTHRLVSFAQEALRGHRSVVVTGDGGDVRRPGLQARGTA